MSFEFWLMEEHAEEYVGPKDMIEAAFWNWLEDLEPEDWFHYANKFAESKVKEREYQLEKGAKHV